MTFCFVFMIKLLNLDFSARESEYPKTSINTSADN